MALECGGAIVICEGPIAKDPRAIRELYAFAREKGQTLFCPLPGNHGKTFSTVEIAMMNAAKEINVHRAPKGGECPYCDKLLEGPDLETSRLLDMSSISDASCMHKIVHVTETNSAANSGVANEHARTTACEDDTWVRDAANLLNATVAHDVLAVNFCLGMRPSSVLCVRGDTHDSVTLFLVYPGGRQVTDSPARVLTVLMHQTASICSWQPRHQRVAMRVDVFGAHYARFAGDNQSACLR
jgi:hypothetical protein